ncbi:MAG: ArsR/SmtB family transcription factor, partial [Thiomonas sp.]
MPQHDTLPELVTPPADDLSVDVDRVFDSAAELFGVLATPLRLRILNSICTGEKSVSDIMSAVDSTQPNVSQHLKVLYQAGVVAKRRVGNLVYYR